MKSLKGIFPALHTPFLPDGSINKPELRRLTEWNIGKGVAGFYVCGSTGSAFLLTEEERKEVLETVCETVNGRCTIIAHIGNISADSAIRLARHAESVGADAVSSIPPFYYKFNFKELKGYYTSIADSVSLPMIMYHFPKLSGVNISLEQYEDMLSDERIVGVKYTDNDFYMLERLKHRFPDKVFYMGMDEMFLSGLVMGVDGGIGSTYNYMAEKFIKMKALFEEGHVAEALALQHEANDIIAPLMKVGIPNGERELLTQLGFDFRQGRAPFKTLSEEERGMIADCIKKSGLKGDK